MIVRIQRFKLCFLFILHLDGRDQRGQNKLPFVVDERAATDLQRLPIFNGRSRRPWSILVC